MIASEASWCGELDTRKMVIWRLVKLRPWFVDSHLHLAPSFETNPAPWASVHTDPTDSAFMTKYSLCGIYSCSSPYFPLSTNFKVRMGSGLIVIPYLSYTLKRLMTQHFNWQLQLPNISNAWEHKILSMTYTWFTNTYNDQTPSGCPVQPDVSAFPKCFTIVRLRQYQEVKRVTRRI